MTNSSGREKWTDSKQLDFNADLNQRDYVSENKEETSYLGYTTTNLSLILIYNSDYKGYMAVHQTEI